MGFQVTPSRGFPCCPALLRRDVAIEVSIGIMCAFVEMRRFIAHHARLFEHIGRVELKQLTYQKKNGEDFKRV